LTKHVPLLPFHEVVIIDGSGLREEDVCPCTVLYSANSRTQNPCNSHSTSTGYMSCYQPCRQDALHLPTTRYTTHAQSGRKQATISMYRV